jgi:Family of unknown function (DUF6982)
VSGPGDGKPRKRLVWATRSPGKVVARYADGQVLKGYAGDFDPDQPRFHLVPAHGSPEDVVEVWLKDLKALFFVRSFEGDPRYVESRDPYRPRPPGTRKVSLEFQDGELLVGYTTTLESRRFGLFVTPIDPQGNNRRVFAVTSSLAGMARLL